MLCVCGTWDGLCEATAGQGAVGGVGLSSPVSHSACETVKLNQVKAILQMPLCLMSRLRTGHCAECFLADLHHNCVRWA